jgi:3-phenylpropionate/trans-cinnamate dioxygenase ferredoxin reductase subunit
MTDVERIRADFAPGRRLVIIGGGYIGLEVAATARELGLDVTVLEMAERVMNRVTCTEISAFYEKEHARHGVRIICNARCARSPATHTHAACARSSLRMARSIQRT